MRTIDSIVKCTATPIFILLFVLCANMASAAETIGENPYVTLLCKFKDYPDEPRDLAYYQGIVDTEYPGIAHFWQENSYGLLTQEGNQAAGWYTLPKRRNRYVDDKNDTVDIDLLVADCTAVADFDVYYPDFGGINFIFNGPLRCCATFGHKTLTLDGVEKEFAVTFIPNGSRPLSVLLHEMGHTLGFLHSGGQYGEAYDSKWDVMSGGGLCSTYSSIFGCIPVHTNAWHKNKAGWIPPAQRFVASPGSVDTITLERTAQPTTGDYLLAEIPIPGSWEIYTVEARRFAGYDDEIPGEAVVLHRWTRGVPLVVDPDLDGDPNDDGAMWTLGETFSDTENGISVTVETDTGTGYRVTLQTDILFYPDLYMFEVSGPSGATAGSDVTVASTVCNQGGGDAVGYYAGSTGFFVGLYLSPDAVITTDDTLLERRFLINLGAGQCSSANVTVTIPADTTDGGYFLGAVADETLVVNESFEDNNELASNAIGIGVAPPTVTTDDATDVTATQATLNGSANPHGQATDAWFEWGETLAYGNLTPVQALGSATSDVSFNEVVSGLSDGTTYHFRTVAQNATGISYGEDRAFLARGPQIDLVPTAATGASEAALGTAVDADVTILNQGTDPSELFRVSLFLADDPTLSGWTRSIDRQPVDDGVAAGQSIVLDFTTAQIPRDVAPATYYLVAWVDDGGWIDETDESNNVLSAGTILITQSDVVVTQLSGPPDAQTASDVTIADTVCNQGQGSTPSTHPTTFTLNYYLSADTAVTGTGDDILLGSRTVGTLAASACHSADTTVTIPFDTAAGTYYFGAIVDGGDVVPESVESNNDFLGNVIDVTPGNLPDLVPSNVTGPTNAKAGDQIGIAYNLDNVGLAGTGTSFIVGLYLSPDSVITQDDIALGVSAPLVAMAAGQSRFYNHSPIIPASVQPGTYYIGVFVDEGDAVVEGDEANNTAASATTLRVK